MKKVLFICKKRVDSYGISYGLINSATFVANYLNHIGMKAKVVTAIDANEIDRIVTQEDPHHVIIEALWITSTKFDQLFSLPRHQKRNWIVRLHSKAPFIANEGIAFAWLKEYRNLQKTYPFFHISANNEEFNMDLEQILGLRMVYLPNIYQPVHPVPECEYYHDYSDGIINIGCFGALRPMKNHLIQAMSAIQFANDRDLKLRFHINSDRIEQNGDQVYKNLKYLFCATKHHQLVEHPWMDYNNFIHLIRKMDLGLQVSLSETFNIVSADMVMANKPTVCSAEIEWAKVFIADPNCTRDIVRKLHRAFSFGFLNVFNKWSLEAYSKKSKDIWFNYLYGYCD